MKPGERVVIHDVPWLAPFGGRTGVVEPGQGVDGRLVVGLDEPVGMWTRCNVHPHEVDALSDGSVSG